MPADAATFDTSDPVSPDDTLGHVRAAAHARPDDERAWRRLARSIETDSGAEAAIDALESARRELPEATAPVTVLSELLCDAGRFDEALRLWAQDGDVDRLISRGDVLLRAARDAEAAQAFGLALIADPVNVRALVGAARVSRRRGDWSESLRRWRLVARAAPADHKPVLQVAGLERLLGEVEAAERSMQKALVLREPGDPKRFWGPPGEPHDAALDLSLEERTARALEDQERTLVTPASPFHPSRPSPIDGLLEAERDSRRSQVRQYPSEAKFLASFLKERGVRSFFETGMRRGAFTHLLDQGVQFDRLGGSELVPSPKLDKLKQDERYDGFIGDHHSAEYREWRRARESYEFVFIDGGHTYNDAMRDYFREREFAPRYIGFHDMWNIGCLGAKRQWDELPGKVAYYCNTDPSEYLLTWYRDRHVGSAFLDDKREHTGFCCGIGIGIVEVGP